MACNRVFGGRVSSSRCKHSLGGWSEKRPQGQHYLVQPPAGSGGSSFLKHTAPLCRAYFCGTEGGVSHRQVRMAPTQGHQVVAGLEAQAREGLGTGRVCGEAEVLKARLRRDPASIAESIRLGAAVLRIDALVGDVYAAAGGGGYSNVVSLDWSAAILRVDAEGWIPAGAGAEMCWPRIRQNTLMTRGRNVETETVKCCGRASTPARTGGRSAEMPQEVEATLRSGCCRPGSACASPPRPLDQKPPRDGRSSRHGTRGLAAHLHNCYRLLTQPWMPSAKVRVEGVAAELEMRWRQQLEALESSCWRKGQCADECRHTGRWLRNCGWN